jgi:hypothetical protein
MEYVSIDEIIITKGALVKLDSNLWTEFFWFKIGMSCGLLLTK